MWQQTRLPPGKGKETPRATAKLITRGIKKASGVSKSLTREASAVNQGQVQDGTDVKQPPDTGSEESNGNNNVLEVVERQKDDLAAPEAGALLSISESTMATNLKADDNAVGAGRQEHPPPVSGIVSPEATADEGMETLKLRVLSEQARELLQAKGVEREDEGAGRLERSGRKDRQGRRYASAEEAAQLRLWHHLRRALSRALDDLYIVCELEQDKAQVSWAHETLQTASLDFSALQRNLLGVKSSIVSNEEKQTQARLTTEEELTPPSIEARGGNQMQAPGSMEGAGIPIFENKGSEGTKSPTGPLKRQLAASMKDAATSLLHGGTGAPGAAASSESSPLPGRYLSIEKHENVPPGEAQGAKKEGTRGPTVRVRGTLVATGRAIPGGNRVKLWGSPLKITARKDASPRVSGETAGQQSGVGSSGDSCLSTGSEVDDMPLAAASARGADVEATAQVAESKAGDVEGWQHVVGKENVDKMAGLRVKGVAEVPGQVTAPQKGQSGTRLNEHDEQKEQNTQLTPSKSIHQSASAKVPSSMPESRVDETLSAVPAVQTPAESMTDAQVAIAPGGESSARPLDPSKLVPTRQYLLRGSTKRDANLLQKQGGKAVVVGGAGASSHPSGVLVGSMLVPLSTALATQGKGLAARAAKKLKKGEIAETGRPRGAPSSERREGLAAGKDFDFVQQPGSRATAGIPKEEGSAMALRVPLPSPVHCPQPAAVDLKGEQEDNLAADVDADYAATCKEPSCQEGTGPPGNEMAGAASKGQQQQEAEGKEEKDEGGSPGDMRGNGVADWGRGEIGGEEGTSEGTGGSSTEDMGGPPDEHADISNDASRLWPPKRSWVEILNTQQLHWGGTVGIEDPENLHQAEESQERGIALWDRWSSPAAPAGRRRSLERARQLHNKFMSPDRRRKSPLETKREVELRLARAVAARQELNNERLSSAHRSAERLHKVSEWQAVRRRRLSEGISSRHARGQALHSRHLAEIVRRAGDESSKVGEVRFIAALTGQNRQLAAQQRLEESEARRQERLQSIRDKQREDAARYDAAQERRLKMENERLLKLAQAQRRKDVAIARLDEERRAALAAQNLKAIEQARKKDERERALQEEAEQAARRLAERLRDSAQRRQLYLDLIRERATTSEPPGGSQSVRPGSAERRRLSGGRQLSVSEEAAGGEDMQFPGRGQVVAPSQSAAGQKRRVKRIRQRLAARKHEFVEPPSGGGGVEAGTAGSNSGASRAAATARVKIGRWQAELQRQQEARNIGVPAVTESMVSEIIKFLEGKDLELGVARQTAFLDYVATAVPASYTSRPQASRVTAALLRLLCTLLAPPASRAYLVARNLVPPLVPMLAAALQTYSSSAAATPSASSPPSAAAATRQGAGGESAPEASTEGGEISHLRGARGQHSAGESVTNVHEGRAVQEATEVSNLSTGVGSVAGQSAPTSSPNDTLGAVLEGLLWALAAVVGQTGLEDKAALMQDDLVELVVACDIIPHLRDLFAIFDAPQVEGAPIPAPVLLGLKLLEALTGPSGKTLLAVHEAPVHFAKPFPGVDVLLGGVERGFVNMEGRFDIADHQEAENSSSPGVGEGRMSHTGSSRGTPAGETSRGMPGEVSPQLHVPGSGAVTVNDAVPGGGSTDPLNCHAQVVEAAASSKATGTLLTAVIETGLVGLPSLLTAVLLRANPPRATPEQVASALPPNFEEVATSVLHVLNNLARLSLPLVQVAMAQPDLRVEFFHLVSFLLPYSAARWRDPATRPHASALLDEALLLIGYVALLHSPNQAVLRWGKSPTILEEICDLPFPYFSDPLLMPLLYGTLLAACYPSDLNRSVVQRELSLDMLLVLLRQSCPPRPPVHGNLTPLPGPPGSNVQQQRQDTLKAPQVLLSPPLSTLISPTSSSSSLSISSSAPVSRSSGTMAKMQEGSVASGKSKSMKSSGKSTGASLTSLRSSSEAASGKLPTVSVTGPQFVAHTKGVKDVTKSSGVREVASFVAGSGAPLAAVQLVSHHRLENRFPPALWDSALEFFSRES